MFPGWRKERETETERQKEKEEEETGGDNKLRGPE